MNTTRPFIPNEPLWRFFARVGPLAGIPADAVAYMERVASHPDDAERQIREWATHRYCGRYIRMIEDRFGVDLR